MSVAGVAAGTSHRQAVASPVISTVKSAAKDMVYVPRGGFFMGIGDSEAEYKSIGKQCEKELGATKFCISFYLLIRDARPGRQVYLDGFWIDRREVTVADYRRCVDRGACDVSPLIIGDTRYQRLDGPISNVTWNEASSFCKSQGKRLPTEAEWEKAARGTDGRRFPWGNVPRYSGANHGRLEDEVLLALHSYVSFSSRALQPEFIEDDSDGARYTALAGSFPFGASPYGVTEMGGNVREWVMDFYWAGTDEKNGYADLGESRPARLEPKPGFANEKVVRGGSWQLPLLFARANFRGHQALMGRHPDLGFRCARGDQGRVRD